MGRRIVKMIHKSEDLPVNKIRNPKLEIRIRVSNSYFYRTEDTMKKYISILICLGLISCGQINYTTAQNDNADEVDPSINLSENAINEIFVFATDYASSGQVYRAFYTDGETTLENSGLTLLGTEAKIKRYNDLLYILHAGAGFNSISTDNLQIVNPYYANTPFKTVSQFSTGNGTNPQDVIIEDDKAFMSLFNPANDPNNVAENGYPADVIEMSTTTGIITHRYSFHDFLEDDGDRNAHAANMIEVNDILYVCLQDLESNTFAPTAPGKIGMIDVTNHSILGVITLESRNPYGLTANSEGTKIYITATHDYTYSGTYGGLEVVDIATKTTDLFIPDDLLEGYVERISMGNDHAFIIVSQYDLETFSFQSKIMRFPADLEDINDISEFKSYGTDIRAFMYQDDSLWVSYRVISTTEGDSNANIKLFDVTTGEQLGETLYPVVAGVSIAGND